MKALTLKLDLATRLPSLRLPGNVKNYTCYHRGSIAFYAAAIPMSTFVETRRKAKHSFKCTGISANKPLLPSVAIPPDSKVLNWKANIRTQCTLLLCLTSGSGRYLHIFVYTSSSEEITHKCLYAANISSLRANKLWTSYILRFPIEKCYKQIALEMKNLH